MYSQSQTRVTHGQYLKQIQLRSQKVIFCELRNNKATSNSWMLSFKKHFQVTSSYVQANSSTVSYALQIMVCDYNTSICYSRLMLFQIQFYSIYGYKLDM